MEVVSIFIDIWKKDRFIKSTYSKKIILLLWKMF